MHLGEGKIFLLWFLPFLLIPASSVSSFPLTIQSNIWDGRAMYQEYIQKAFPAFHQK